jgi:prepilin-type N-terminal cleavage/methylation domain-containing protein
MTRYRRSGFTLVEMLVVIVIIAILAGLLTTTVISSLRTAKMKNTRTKMIAIEASLDTYKLDFGDFPPTTLEGFGKTKSSLNRKNNGAEALVACLASKRKGGAPYYQPSDESGAYANTDDDTASANFTGWYFGDTKLREYADDWGNPVVYIHHRNYQRPTVMMQEVQLANGKSAMWQPEKLQETKAFPNARKFIMISAGPDGIMGTADDVKNY